MLKNLKGNEGYKALTLMGMSGVGKTYLSQKLEKWGWYHYSCDVEIGTNILQRDILESIKQDILAHPGLRRFLETGAIQINNNITAENLSTLSAFIGQLGNPTQGRLGNTRHGGLDLKEFKRRQRLYYDAECRSLLQVEQKIKNAKKQGYENFVNDSTGSMCEVGDESILNTVARNTLIVYIQATLEEEREVIRRAEEYPKPLLFPHLKFDGWLSDYLEEKNIKSAEEIEPDDFSRWSFPRLLRHRIPRYEEIAQKYGITISSADLKNVGSEGELLNILTKY